MRSFFHLRYYFSHLCIFIVILFLTFPVRAQTGYIEDKNEQKDENISFGGYLSAIGLLSKTSITDINCYAGACADDDDDIPYSAVHISIRYKAYQSIILFSGDENEFILNLTGRYNHYLIKNKKYLYVYGGLSAFYFNRKMAYRDVIVDRPNGITITPAFIGGLGLQGKIPPGLVFSLETEVFGVPCKYKEYICGLYIADVKIGIHIDI